PIPAGLPVIGLDLVCSSSGAAINGGRPASPPTAEVPRLGLNLLGPVADTPLATVTETLGTGLDQLLGALAPVLGPIDDNSGLGLEDTLGDLFDAALGDTNLVNVEIGTTAATTTVTDTELVSTCRTDGVTITALDPVPVAGVDPDPVLQIILGPVQTAVSVDL